MLTICLARFALDNIGMIELWNNYSGLPRFSVPGNECCVFGFLAPLAAPTTGIQYTQHLFSTLFTLFNYGSLRVQDGPSYKMDIFLPRCTIAGLVCKLQVGTILRRHAPPVYYFQGQTILCVARYFVLIFTASSPGRIGSQFGMREIKSLLKISLK